MGSITPNPQGAWYHSVDERFGLIKDTLEKDANLAAQLPGFHDLLEDYLDDDVEVDNVQFYRRLLKVFRDSPDQTYEQLLQDLSAQERQELENFVRGGDIKNVKTSAPLLTDHVQNMTESFALRVSPNGAVPEFPEGLDMSLDDSSLETITSQPFIEELSKHLPPPPEGQVSDFMVLPNVKFENWGLVFEYMPSFTCIPTKVRDIQAIIKAAAALDLGVRCAGFRHSWAPIFGRDGQILISLLNLKEVTQLPNFLALDVVPLPPPNELETIDVIPNTPKLSARVKDNTLVRVGVSCTNERLRRWCVESNKYTLPLNVIMVEMTLGGTNGPICHGAGIRHQTLSDLVRSVEYIDCNGNQQTVQDPEQLRAAAGCFGMMGVITHITLEFSPMTYALIQPTKLAVVRAVPPPDDMPEDQIPQALRIKGLTAQQKAQDVADFEKKCATNFYSEWFWFPFSDRIWINCWDDTTDPKGAAKYPSSITISMQIVQQYVANLVQNAPCIESLQRATGTSETAVTILSRVAMFLLPEMETPYKTYLPDALHFQRGIQNVRVLDMEVEMPIPPKARTGGNGPDVADFGVVRRAWWDAILKCYEHSYKSPQRLPLEMRIMGDSNVIMAPQRGNKFGTCSIEILTLENVRDLWNDYAQDVLNKWMSYTDRDGNKLKTRPHWAKQWVQFQVDGKPWKEKLREDYKDEIVEFKGLLAAIGKDHGWTLADLKKRFSNDLFDDFYFGDVVVKGEKAL